MPILQVCTPTPPDDWIERFSASDSNMQIGEPRIPSNRSVRRDSKNMMPCLNSKSHPTRRNSAARKMQSNQETLWRGVHSFHRQIRQYTEPGSEETVEETT